MNRLFASLAGPARIAAQHRLGAAPAVVLALLLAGCTPSAPQTDPAPTVTNEPIATSATSAAPATSAPSASPSPSSSMLDTSRWTPYTSEQHGFSLMHPPGWTVNLAEHGWTLEEDANRPASTGQDGFMSPDGDIYVTVWSTPAADMPETSEGVANWVEEYCETSGYSCPGILDRAVKLCNESKDCHPGLLVPFADQESHAFFTGGKYEGIIGAAVWRPEGHESVAPYGGARRLLEAFLSTMDVCPAQGQPPSGCPAESG